MAVNGGIMEEVHAKVAIGDAPDGDDQVRVRFTTAGADAGELRVEDGALWWREAGAKDWTHRVPVGKMSLALASFRL